MDVAVGFLSMLLCPHFTNADSRGFFTNQRARRLDAEPMKFVGAEPHSSSALFCSDIFCHILSKTF